MTNVNLDDLRADDDNDFPLGDCPECRNKNVEIDLTECMCINCAKRLRKTPEPEDDDI